MKLQSIILIVLAIALIAGCQIQVKIEKTAQLADKVFAVPQGTIADELVRSKYATAQFKYFNDVAACCEAVMNGEADAAAYDEPILKNIAAKTPGLKVLADMITVDHYGIAVQKENTELADQINAVLDEINSNGYYTEMIARWLPEEGAPAPMPEMPEVESDDVLRLGTAAVTEPFSFVDGNQQIVGIDIELAKLIAQKLNKKLEIVNMEFGEMIPALEEGKVDMIAACITISPERQEKVLFSKPYYKGGIAALVKE